MGSPHFVALFALSCRPRLGEIRVSPGAVDRVGGGLPQFLQLGWATSSWYFPGSQAAHTSAPADADLPMAQLLQLVDDASSWNLPLGHTRQRAWPIESWKRPATQG